MKAVAKILETGGLKKRSIPDLCEDEAAVLFRIMNVPPDNAMGDSRAGKRYKDHSEVSEWYSLCTCTFLAPRHN